MQKVRTNKGLFMQKSDRAPVAQLVEHRVVMREVVRAAFVITSANGLIFESSRIRTVNRRSRLVAFLGNQIVWDLKNPLTFRKD